MIRTPKNVSKRNIPLTNCGVLPVWPVLSRNLQTNTVTAMTNRLLTMTRESNNQPVYIQKQGAPVIRAQSSGSSSQHDCARRLTFPTGGTVRRSTPRMVSVNKAVMHGHGKAVRARCAQMSMCISRDMPNLRAHELAASNWSQAILENSGHSRTHRGSRTRHTQN
jgi:hypothetical protein